MAVEVKWLMDNPGLWQDRWSGLQGAIGLYGAYLRDHPPSREPVLSPLGENLGAFAQGMYEFFMDGFGANTQRKLGTAKYPPEYALTVGLEQVAYDLEAMWRAVSQRALGPLGVQQALATADKLAWQALAPAQGILPGATTVVTYLQKSTSIRMIPYANVALIGVPFSCVSFRQDYLAIPHEVGHYVFRHGNIDWDTIFAGLLPEPAAPAPYWYKWVEEIFADVYGCLVGGRVIALDFQDLQLEYVQERFTKDDKTHPVPCFRPEIYMRVLSQMEIPVSDLQTEWTSKLELRGAPDSFVVLEGNTKSLADARTDVYPFVDRISTYLRENGLGASGDLWSDNSTVVDELYQVFVDTRIGQLEEGIQASDLDNVTILSASTDLWTNWVNVTAGVTTGEIEEDSWIRALDSDGWATKGPRTSIDSGD